MAVEVKCCIYNGDVRVINKKPTEQKTINCRITEESDVVDPAIYINNEDDVSNCNYFVIGYRKYFKVGQSRVSGNRIRIRLHEDIISTWLPRVDVKGYISNASYIRSNDILQDYQLRVNRKISRLTFTNQYGEISNGHPAVIVQSPLPVKVYSPAQD